MGKKEKIPPPGNKNDACTNFMTKAKWKQALARQALEVAGRNLRGYGALVVGNALTKNRYVCKADFSHNSLGDEGAINFAQVIKVNEFITTLDLSCNGISDIGGVAIASAFIPAANPTGQPAQWNRSLWYLNMSGNNMRDDAMVAFSNAIACHRQFTQLDVRNNQIGGRGCQHLARTWRRTQTSCVVLVSGNPLGDEGVTNYCSAWKGSVLALNNCDVSKGGAEAIGTLLVDNTTLQVLNLAWNTLGYKGTEALVDRLSMKRCVLYSINLQDNCLDDDAAEEIARLIEANIPTLKKIDISRNAIRDKGGEAVARSMQRSTVLEAMIVSHNHMADKAMEQFAEAVKVCKTLALLDVKRNNFADAGKDALFIAGNVNGTCRVDMGASSAPGPDEKGAAFEALMSKFAKHMKQMLDDEENAKASKKKKKAD